jgi:predicted kinase
MSSIHIVFGAQGSGKSFYARKLSIETNGVLFSIDEWMWNLYGPDMPSPININWVMERVVRSEKQIWATAKQIAKNGGSVVLDLGFIKLKDRQKYIALSSEENIRWQLHYVTAPRSVRSKRVLERNAEKGSTFSFEVTSDMFEFMEKEFESPAEEELHHCLVINTGID